MNTPLSSSANPQSAAASQSNGGKRDLIGLSRKELGALLAGLDAAPYRVKQLWHWIYHRGITDFDAMTSLGKPLRAALKAHCTITRPAISQDALSADNTRKWLFRLGDGSEIETVFIPEEDRGTLCVSSQVGCTLTCRFCHTGTQRLLRNLTQGEIVGQVIAAMDALGEWPAAQMNRRISNIVMMGMGEPLYNLDNVAAALDVIADGDGIGISRRRITLSTAGVVPKMKECGERTGVNLAVSLHATTDELRNELVPLNKKYPLAELIAACRDYPGADNSRRITFEYIMLKGVNDTPDDARRLVALIRGLPAKVNLIPFNPWPGTVYERSEMATIERFAQIVREGGYPSPVRMPRGDDILAACGQLRSQSAAPSRRAREAAAMASNPPGATVTS